jgi:hypothetical protein
VPVWVPAPRFIYAESFEIFRIQNENLCNSKMNTALPKIETMSARKRVRSKYIIIKHAGMEVPLVFSPVLSHKHVAGMTKVESAGYCQLDIAGRWVAGGSSDSLDLCARPQDTDILNERLWL